MFGHNVFTFGDFSSFRAEAAWEYDGEFGPLTTIEPLGSGVGITYGDSGPQIVGSVPSAIDFINTQDRSKRTYRIQGFESDDPRLGTYQNSPIENPSCASENRLESTTSDCGSCISGYEDIDGTCTAIVNENESSSSYLLPIAGIGALALVLLI